MNRKDLANEVSQFILNSDSLTEDGSGDVDLGEAASAVEEFIQELPEDSDEDA